jgi:hypothetical protein
VECSPARVPAKTQGEGARLGLSSALLRTQRENREYTDLGLPESLLISTY